jgi:hypothetical protein
MEEKRNTPNQDQGGIGRSNFINKEGGKAIEKPENVSNRNTSSIDQHEGKMNHGVLGGNFNQEQTNDERTDNR